MKTLKALLLVAAVVGICVFALLSLLKIDGSSAEADLVGGLTLQARDGAPLRIEGAGLEASTDDGSGRAEGEAGLRASLQRLRVHVSSASELGLLDAWLYDGAGSSRAALDAARTVELEGEQLDAAREHGLLAVASGHAPVFVQASALRAACEGGELSVVLEAEATISGRLELPDGVDPNVIQVSLVDGIALPELEGKQQTGQVRRGQRKRLAENFAATMNLHWMRRDLLLDGNRRVLGDAKRFRLRGLVPGRAYRVRFRDLTTNQGWDAGPIAAGSSGIVLHMPALATRSIAGRCRDTRGMPLVGARIECGAFTIEGQVGTGFRPCGSARSDSTGAFVLREVPTSVRFVRIEHVSCFERRVEVEAGRGGLHLGPLVFRRCARVELVRAAGSAALASVVALGADGAPRDIQTTGAQGFVRVTRDGLPWPKADRSLRLRVDTDVTSIEVRSDAAGVHRFTPLDLVSARGELRLEVPAR